MKKMELMIGPCVLESEQLALEVASTLVSELGQVKDQLTIFFKGSFDKANRTSIDSYRGPGLEEGLRILSSVKEKTGLPVVTDIHLPMQAQAVAEVADILQIPAFLCRQTDLIVEAAQACQKFGRILNVKKGQFLSPEEAKNIVTKAQNFLSLDQIILTERGTSFGYNNLVVDMASFEIMKSFGVKAIHDATHSAQRPGGLGSSTAGKREQIFTVGKAALAAGADGIFMETHPNPEKAKSDATTQVPLNQAKKMVEGFLHIFQANQSL